MICNLIHQKDLINNEIENLLDIIYNKRQELNEINNKLMKECLHDWEPDRSMADPCGPTPHRCRVCELIRWQDIISTFNIPPKWNGLRFRSVNITKDSGNIVYDLYLGTLGGDIECDLVYVGQISFTSGDQDSSYYQTAFTSGGTHVPKKGNIAIGNTSEETAVVISVTLSSGAWADGDAAGTIQYRTGSGAFTGGETIKIVNPRGVTQSDVLTHTGTVVLFEWADTVAVTAKSWGASWSSVSPADDTIAETELDVKGADFLVALASTCAADGKLLVKGY